MEFKFCAILSLIQVGRSLTDCPSTVYRDVQGFGPGCRYRCNCNTQLCHNVTGQCQDGCKSGWMGPSCQYRNIANLIRSSRQYPTALVGATLEYPGVAIDGNVATCSRTGPDFNQPGQKYWHGDLKEQTYIVGFVIKINQPDSGRFRGFSIKVGNTTNTLTMCYRHINDSDGAATIIDINCQKPVVGNIIRISLAENETSALVLCEVEIYGGRLVSFHKPTYTASTVQYAGFWNSSYAVDGRSPSPSENQDNAILRTCAATMYQTDPWWTVNLTNVYSIIAVNFYGRFTQVEQFNNFIVKAGLDNNYKTIFTDPGSTNVNDYQPRSKNLIWPVDGALVRVERNGLQTIVVICELEIFADCRYGLCGMECNETCMCSSQTTGAHKILGTCPYGCTGRWTGLDNKCNIECLPSKWGPYCNNTCSGNCEGGADCDAATGFCPGYCKPGWKPLQCSKECSDGTYGINCTSTCGRCMDISQCNKTSGHCASGCQPGYKQPRCIDKCDNGTYGMDCANECGNCLNKEQCQHANGTCLNGCTAGYEGFYCNRTCSWGFYGLNCSRKCGHCINHENCDHIKGLCYNGCQPGFKTLFCNETCDVGYYGDGCNNRCGYCFDNDSCMAANGSCPGRCATGYSTDICKQPCDYGNYGPNCVSVCGACDVVTNCHIETGKCSNGCLPGRLGIFCRDPCPEGYYGQSCYVECGHCKENKTCEPQTGHCELCAEGYTGEFCKTICQEGRYGEGCVHSCGHCADSAPCNKTTGYCPMGCISEYTGSRCIEATSPPTALSAGAIVGVVVGVIVVIATVIIIAMVYKRRTLKEEADNIYTKPSVTATKSDSDVYDVIVNNT